MAEGWTFLTNHARVLLTISRDPTLRMHEIAAAIGIRERSVAQIVRDLDEAGYLTRAREGRRNVYTVHRNAGFRHETEAGHEVGELLDVFSDD